MHFHRWKFRRDEFYIAELIGGNVPQFKGERHKISRMLLHKSFRCAVKRCHLVSFKNGLVMKPLPPRCVRSSYK